MKTKSTLERPTKNPSKSPKKQRASASPPAKSATKNGGFFATVKGLLSSAPDEAPKATALLEKQHRKVEKLFAAIESANGNAKALVHELATELLAHMVIEEKIFYPRALGIEEGTVLEGYEEHVVARFALERLLVTSPKDKSFIAKTKTLKDIVLDHAKEEEDELFPKVKKAMTGKVLRELGARMQTLFDATVADGWEKTLAAEGPDVSRSVRRASARATATS